MNFSEVNLHRSINAFNCPLDAWTLSEWYTAVMGEFGEVVETFESAEFTEELADLYTYLDLLYQKLGYTILDPVCLGNPLITVEDYLLTMAKSLGLAGNCIKKLNRIEKGMPEKNNLVYLQTELQSQLDQSLLALHSLFDFLQVDMMKEVWKKFDTVSVQVNYVR